MDFPDVCLDANVFVSALTPEHRQPIALDLIGRVQKAQGVFFEPGLVLFETVSVLYRKMRMQEIQEARVGQALHLLNQFPLLVEWQSNALLRSSYWAGVISEKNAYDACYLAVAEMRNVPFITWDKELVCKAKPHFRNIWSVEEFLAKHS